MAQRASIEKIVYGGWGLAHHAGETLFLPYTAPGDTVDFTAVKRRKNCLFGRIERIVEPSPMRREPECPVFGTCGGCHFLHIGYRDELEIKRTTVVENLERIGKIRIGLEDVIPSPSRFGYRNHTVLRTDAHRRGGYTRMGSDELIPLPPQGCLFLPREMRDAIDGLDEASIPPHGEIRVRLDRDGAVHFWGLDGREGPPDVLMETGSYLFAINPGVFFQINRLINDKLQEIVVSLPIEARRKLLDLYCGAGFFTLPLSRIVNEAVGIERNRTAARNAAASARLNKVSNVRFKSGAVEREIHRIRDVDIVIADPPRTGIADAALRGIVRLRPKEVIVVSCEPPTFSRDAAKLVDAGYILSRIILIDLFPGTYHVETVALFRRS